MNNIIPLRVRAAIQDEALEWIVKIDQGNLSDQDKLHLNVWLNVDESHRQALRHAAEMWDNLESLSVLAEVFPLDSEQAVQPSWYRQHYLGSTIAAVLLLALVLWFPQYYQKPIVDSAQHYQTALNEQSKITLPDGSQMTLNALSQVRVSYSEAQRSIELLAGEAHFKVASNAQRPFVVYAGDGLVRAVGTAFSVKLKAEGVDVRVAEGIVEVVAGVGEQRGATRTASLSGVRVESGGEANYQDVVNKVEYVDAAVLANKLAWTDGKWVFQGETLAEVIGEASRYSGRSISINDPAIANLRIGAYFNAGDVEALLDTLEVAFDIDVKRFANGNIQLSARAPAQG